MSINKYFMYLSTMLFLMPLTIFSEENNITQGAKFNSATYSGEGLTTSGFSGLINVATANTQNGFMVSLLTSSNFKETAFLPRATFGFANSVEIAIGLDFPLTDMSTFFSGLTGIKWKFWDADSVQLATSANIQFNSTAESLNIDSQILLHATWYLGSNFQTTAVFGKTFGQTSGMNLTEWDFGMGFQWWLLTNKIFQLAAIVDFSNYEYRAYIVNIPSAGASYRGNITGVARFGFFEKMILVDVGATNLLEGQIALFVSTGVSLNF